MSTTTHTTEPAKPTATAGESTGTLPTVRTAEPSEVQQTAVEGFIQQAIERQVPIETLERLIALRNGELARQAKDAYFRALGQLQSEVPVIGKSRPVLDRSGAEMYRFASLEDIKAVADKHIAKHGFSYRWDTREKEVACIITHVAGHSEESRFPFHAAKAPAMNDMQALASGGSYAKRYSFINGFGFVVGDEDDDAKHADPVAYITPEQVIQLNEMIDAYKVNRPAFLTWIGAASVEEIPAGKFPVVYDMLRKKGGAK